MPGPQSLLSANPWESEDPMGVRRSNGSPGNPWESGETVGVRGCELHPELE